MANIKRGHLCATTTAGRGHGEAHLVEDIHEGEGTGGVRACAGHVRAARAQRGKIVANAAARLKGQAGFVDLAQDVVHGIGDGARHSAVNGRRGRFIRLRACI